MLRVALAIVMALSAATSNAASFTPLGFLPGGHEASVATAVSADGSVVVGYAGSPTGREAFRWSAAGGLVALTNSPSLSPAEAWGVSADGSVIVGRSNEVSPGSAFRWTATGGMSSLGTLPGGEAAGTPVAISADGSVVAGGTEGSRNQAIRWTEAEGMVSLGDLSESGFLSGATAISSDGATIVGSLVSLGTFHRSPFRWTQSTGIVSLGDVPGGDADAVAWDLSDDGSVVVGEASRAGLVEGFRWTAESGMTVLGSLPGGTQSSVALGVSGDGSVIVGEAALDGAFMWTTQSGMVRLFDYLVAQGATDLDGWQLSGVLAISTNGEWVVGYGSNPDGHSEAFLANLHPVPVSPAAWLFGSALGVMSCVRRKASP